MKFLLYGYFLGLTVLCGFGQAPQTKTVFIIVDGISADVIEKQPTPHLDAIAAVGGYARAYVGGGKGEYSQTPTISAVGYNSLLTGTWTNKHNVWDNDIDAPNYHYPTVFKLFREQRPAASLAVFSTWEDNRTKLIGENLPETGHLKMDYSFDGYELDTTTFPHDSDSEYIKKIDQYVVKQAVRTLGEEGPDVSWVYLQYTDDMGHKYGDSDQYYKAVKIMDDQMGQIWTALQERMQHHNEVWNLYITTDHGRDEATGKHHGGQSDRERLTWIVTNVSGLNTYFMEHTPGIVSILPTILRTHKIVPQKEQLWELDGVPLVGKVSVADPKAVLNENTITLTWQPLEQQGKVKIWISPTNNFATGGQDDYILLDQVKTKAGKTTLDVGQWPSDQYKIVLEGKHNTVNAWALRNPGPVARIRK